MRTRVLLLQNLRPRLRPQDIKQAKFATAMNTRVNHLTRKILFPDRNS